MLQISRAPVASTGLPLWAQLSNLAITLLLAVLRAVEFLRRGTLEVRITRDCFFRLTDFGEALFVHGVLLARNGPVLIQDVAVTLKRLAPRGTTVAEKSFPLTIISHGEKVKGPAFRAEHHFYGMSPLLYVAGPSTLRPVYHCQHAEYKDRQRQAVLDFEQELRQYRQKFNTVVQTETQLLKDLDVIIKPHYNKMCGLIQLESGQYELSLSIKYEKCGSIVWRRHATTESYIYFAVDEAGLKAYKDALLYTLNAQAGNILRGTDSRVDYPEYSPRDFKEAKKKQPLDG
jgi:hypothetical protein